MDDFGLSGSREGLMACAGDFVVQSRADDIEILCNLTSKNDEMRVCPKCTAIRVRASHARNGYENFLKNLLGYRFYRCQQCGWRDKVKIKKKSAKLKIWQVLGIYALAALILLFIVFVVVGVGNTTPPPPPQ